MTVTYLANDKKEYMMKIMLQKMYEIDKAILE